MFSISAAPLLATDTKLNILPKISLSQYPILFTIATYSLPGSNNIIDPYFPILTQSAPGLGLFPLAALAAAA